MDKKGALGTSQVILQFLAYFLLIAIILVTLLSFNNISKKDQARIDSITSDIGQSTFVMNYLRTPVDHLGRQSNMAELIALWHADSSFKKQLADETTRILDDFYNAEVYWKLEAGEKEIDNYLIKDVIPFVMTRDPLIHSGAVIPDIFSENSIDVNVTVFMRYVNEDEWCYNPAIQRCNKDRRRICRCDRVGYKLLWVCKECASGKCDNEEARCR